MTTLKVQILYQLKQMHLNTALFMKNKDTISHYLKYISVAVFKILKIFPCLIFLGIPRFIYKEDVSG